MLTLRGSPKARVQAAFPKAQCKMNWGKGYCIDLWADATDFNGRTVRLIQTRSHNPAEAWEFAAYELRLDTVQQVATP